jgi:ubiquinone/menaquinone biosynthesis C-methylase UbiE
MTTPIPTTPTTRNAESKDGIRGRLLKQFSRPEGWLGHLAGFILANRKSNRERNRWTVDLLDIQPDDRVLELGFGPGVSIATASALATKGVVVGIDHSETMLRVASRRNSNGIREGRVLLFEAPLERLPDFRESFDKVFAVNAVQFAEDPLAVLRSVHERMRRGGLIAITQQSRKPDATDRDSIQAADRTVHLLEEAGFDSTRIETLPLKPACAACVLATRV